MKLACTALDTSATSSTIAGRATVAVTVPDERFETPTLRRHDGSSRK
jgi:hypothetical protein